MRKKILVCIMSTIFLVLCMSLYYLMKDSKLLSMEKNIEIISNYNNPIVPQGFKRVETDLASWKLEEGIPIGWNNGLVIEDEIGNQFVWVPVNLEDEEYKKLSEESSNKYYNKKDLHSSIKEENQIMKYGGFYISRYEAGISEEIRKNTNAFSAETNNIEGIPVSKEGQIPWNYISWGKAKKNSENMYQENSSVESNLMTARQLGSLYYWLDKTGYNFENSKEWGNFSDVNFRFTGYYSTDYGRTYNYVENKLKSQYNMLLSTGATERNKSNNIYDFVGNVMEYIDVIENDTNKGKILNYYVIGGYYDNTSQYHIMKAYGVTSKQGFRVILYNRDKNL